MKRFYLAVVATLLSMLLSACGSGAAAEQKSELDTDTGNTFSSYDEIIEVISKGLKEGFPEDAMYEMEFAGPFFMKTERYEILGYMLRDLDGDGTEELLLGENSVDDVGPNVGWDSIIYDLFTMQDGKVVHLFFGGERNRYYLCTDGIIANEGSSGAAVSNWAYYKLNDGKVEIIESIFTDEDDHGVHWYLSDKEPYEDKSNEISEDEGWKLIEKHTYQKLEFTPFER